MKNESFDIETYDNGYDGYHGVIDNLPDLIILDIKMPRMDGMEVLKKLREKTDTPVIMLTSKEEEEDELSSFKIGADDYIKKPFSLNLLIARVKTIIRRSNSTLGNGNPKNKEDLSNIINKGFLKLDKNQHTCFWKDTPLSLTITEFLILLCLVERVGHIKTRNQLIDYAYGTMSSADDRMIDTHIKRLRKKFKEIDDGFDKIETMYGLGYRYKE
ncbi:MAG: Transcriptional regulatory protein SrrA [Alphaproteobacteria bacterium ADurb.Bin438]|nr:MAG: Transcriptional regulatory protein SrrA [Alphaproteobacteria bacterium ADurb.Bin438]